MFELFIICILIYALIGFKALPNFNNLGPLKDALLIFYLGGSAILILGLGVYLIDFPDDVLNIIGITLLAILLFKGVSFLKLNIRPFGLPTALHLIFTWVLISIILLLSYELVPFGHRGFMNHWAPYISTILTIGLFVKSGGRFSKIFEDNKK